MISWRYYGVACIFNIIVLLFIKEIKAECNFQHNTEIAVKIPMDKPVS